jgi:hypothetical protein
MKILRLTESQLKSIVKQVVVENEMEQSNYMFFSNLEQIERQCKLLRNIDPSKIDELLNNGHDWADDHIAEAKVNMDQVFDFIMNETKGSSHDDEPVHADMDQFSVNEVKKMKNPCWKGYRAYGMKEKNGKQVPNCVPIDEDKIIEEDEYGIVESTDFIADDLLNEAEYQGRKVQLGKIMQGDVKKFKVYVKNDKGKVVKVNFGFGGKSAHGKVMKIKKNNPERRKSFRARHHCENPGPRWKARYWACRTW